MSVLTKPAGQAKICAAATFAHEGLAVVGQFWERMFDHTAPIQWAEYGQILPTLLDPSSEWQRAPGPKVLFVRTGDALLSDATFKDAILDLAQEHAVAIVLCPTTDRSNDPDARLLFSGSRVEFISGADAIKVYGVKVWADKTTSEIANLPYTEEASVAMMTAMVRWAMPQVEKPVKMIVVDADNTLWSGVIGEDGPEGIVISDGHLALHHRLVSAARAGKIIALATKNNPEDVERAWQTSLQSSLPRDLILSVEAGWDAKSASLHKLIDLYQVEPKSCLFLDDNPMECAEVSSALPDVRTVQVPQSQHLSAFVDHLWALDATATTEEDAGRLASYRASAERKQAESAAPNLAHFFETLGLEIDIGPAGAADIDRVCQLSVRTTQFNIAPKPLNPSDITDEAIVTKIVRVRDRFGDYGIVGVMRYATTLNSLIVYDFLLSCRALGKGVEHQMVRRLGQFAEQCGADELRVHHTRTSRNAPIRRFFNSVVGDADVDATEYVMGTDHAANCRFDPSGTGDWTYGTKSGASVPNGSTKFSRGELDQKIASELTSAPDIIEEMTPSRTRPSEAGPYTPAKTELERVISAAWEQALRIRPIGIFDDLPKLGAKSLHLVRAHSRIQRSLSKPIDVSVMFRGNSVAELSNLIAGTTTTARNSESRSSKIGRASAAIAARRRQAKERRS